MNTALSARHLYDNLKDKLQLSWAAGQSGGDGIIIPADVHEATTTLIGHLNFIHPNCIQIVGKAEIKYLHGLGRNSYRDSLQHLFSQQGVMVIVADGQALLDGFREAADHHHTPLLRSPQPGNELMSALRYYLSNLVAEKATVHGVFMDVIGCGVLLIGESGIGKSELALELVSRGHRLVADDAPEFRRIAPDIINGTCPKPLREFLEVRGMGILNIRSIFGDSAVKSAKYLRLVIKLEHLTNERLLSLDRLRGERRSYKLLGMEIPSVTLFVAPGRNLAVAVETAVRNYILRQKGYDAAEDFLNRQRRSIQENAEAQVTNQTLDPN